MLDLTASPLTALLGTSTAVLFVWKVLWPVLRGFVETQNARSGAESGLLTQTSAELTKALARADDERKLRMDAEKVANDYFVRFTELSAKFQTLETEVAELRAEIASWKGKSNA